MLQNMQLRVVLNIVLPLTRRIHFEVWRKELTMSTRRIKRLR